MNSTTDQGPKIPRALADYSRRELRQFAAMMARRDEMVRSAHRSGVGVNEIARLSSLAKTTVLRILEADS